MMVSVQSLVMLLHGWDRGSLPEIPIELLKNRVIPVLFGVTVETLQKQNPDGSWGFQSCETTAYAILCLSEVAALPLCDCLLPTIQLAVKNGRTFLMQQISRWKEPDKVWISKIAFGAGVVTEAYTLAAMKISPGNRSFGKGIGDLCKITKPSLSTVQEISHLPFFAGMPDWLVGACIVEAYLHLPIYDKVRRAVMTHEVKQQRPFNITPFVLIASSRSAGAFIAPDVNIEFMVLIALTYEVDHYMEDIIGGWKETEVQQVANIVGEIFDEPWIELPKPRTNRTLKDGGSNAQPPGHLDVVEDTLRPAISWVLNHPKVRSSSRYDQAILRREFRALYLGNITSIYESADLATSRQLPRSPTLVREPYHHWVHGTSSAHIAGPAVFAFLTCLLGPRTDGRDCFPGPEAKYFAQDLSMHLSSLARMENDIGSAVRDRKEHNLNSIDFAEFDPGSPPEHGDDDLQARLAHLRRLASYERECSRMALAKLRAVGVGERAMQWLQAFCNAIDLFGQIYATEDISPTLQRCS